MVLACMDYVHRRARAFVVVDIAIVVMLTRRAIVAVMLLSQFLCRIYIKMLPNAPGRGTFGLANVLLLANVAS